MEKTEIKINKDCEPCRNNFGKPLQKGRKSSVKFLNIVNPLPPEMEDSKEMKDFLDKWGLIPYAGTDRCSANTLLRKFIDLKTLSPTFGACVEAIKNFSFGGGQIDFVRSKYRQFQFAASEDLSEGIKGDFADFLSEIDLNGKDWMSFAESVSESIDTSGMAGAEIVMMETAGVKTAKIIYHRPTHYLRVAPYKTRGREIMAISPVWSESYFEICKPRFVPLYPAVSKPVRGVSRTFVHYKEGEGFYGRPLAYNALLDIWNEYQVRAYLSKTLNKGIISQLILDVPIGDATGDDIEEGARDAGYENAIHRLEENITNEGDDPTSVMLFTSSAEANRGVGVTQIKPNINPDFFREIEGTSRLNIIRAMDWSEMLLTMNSTSGFNNQQFMDLLEVQSAMKIQSRQASVSKFTYDCYAPIIDFFGREEFKEVRFKYQSAIQKLVMQKMEALDMTQRLTENLKAV